MKGLFGACAAVAATAFLVPGLANAQVILQQRCTLDSMDPVQAEARLNWARRCGLDINVRDVNANFDIGVPSTTGSLGTSLQEYAEESANAWTGQNNYTSQADGLEVNNSFIIKLYNSGGTYQDKDEKAYYRWSRAATRKKARPLYPTFGSEYDINSPTNKQLFPNLANNSTDCGFYTDVNRTQRYTGPVFFINGICESSCYTPEQKVLFSDGYAPIVDAVAALREDVVTLTPDSSLDNVQLKTGRVYSYTKEIRDANHPVVELKTASGGQLRVTVEHPVVTGEGRLVAAQTLKVGDELVKSDGSRDRIVELNRTQYYGRVYNLRPDTSDRTSNLLVAEGFLVGSSLFQNDEVGYVNRVILHRSVPAHVIP